MSDDLIERLARKIDEFPSQDFIVLSKNDAAASRAALVALEAADAMAVAFDWLLNGFPDGYDEEAAAGFLSNFRAAREGT